MRGKNGKIEIFLTVDLLLLQVFSVVVRHPRGRQAYMSCPLLYFIIVVCFILCIMYVQIVVVRFRLLCGHFLGKRFPLG